MIDDLELRKRTEKAREAERLLDNPLLQEAFEVVRESCIETWMESDDLDTRENAHRSLKMLGHVKEAIRGFVRDGKRASHELKEREERGDAA